jgi:hypothetical protein
MDSLILYVKKSHNMRITRDVGGLHHAIVTIASVRYIMKTGILMSTTNTDPVPQTTDNEQTNAEEGSNIDPTAIKWEEWALSAEEHYHALTKFRENPRGRPMGHKS